MATAMASGFVVTIRSSNPSGTNRNCSTRRKMEGVGRLASGLAHDFANLLTLISGYSEILLARVGSGDPSRPELNEIRKAANRGAELTSQLLAYSRRHAVEPQLLDLNALVADMQSMLRRIIGEHIDLGTQLGSGLGTVKADAGQMQQVIMNLAINARDAMPRGGKISIRTDNVLVGSDHERARFGTQPGRYVMLQVSDTGQGIDPAALERVFEPFFTTKEKGKGTGLGLATVYGIVKQGAAMCGRKASLAGARRSPSTCRAWRRGCAGRDEGNRTRRAVGHRDHPAGRGRGWRPAPAQAHPEQERIHRHRSRSGPEALAAYRQLRRPIDLLLTDIVMPRMSGRELGNAWWNCSPA